MFRDIASAIKELLLLRESTKKNTDDIAELQKDVKVLTAAVQQLVYEVRGNKNDEAYERENMALRLQTSCCALSGVCRLRLRTDTYPEQEHKV